MAGLVRFHSVSKTYARHHKRQFFRSFLTEWMKNRKAEKFYALRDVSFALENGESLAVIGPNGAGKSTLLNLLAGLSVPNAGAVEVEGKIAALLELGSGFHPDLTGAENLRLNAAIHGFTRKQVAESFDRIVEFSGIGDFIDEPLRTYSSGMWLRLAFSIAIHVSPDILLVDEVLAVGDQDFQAKCIERIFELKRAGTIFVCVSHAPETLRKLCEKGLWLNAGQVVKTGPLEEVLEAYQSRAAAAVSS